CHSERTVARRPGARGDRSPPTRLAEEDHVPQQPPDDLRSRIAELESRVRALEAGSAPPSRAEPGASASASDASASASDASASASDASASEPAPSVPAQDPLWALRRMRELFPSSGAVMYSGAVD